MQRPGLLKKRNFYPKIFFRPKQKFLILTQNDPKNPNEKMSYTSLKKKKIPPKEKLLYLPEKITSFLNEQILL